MDSSLIQMHALKTHSYLKASKNWRNVHTSLLWSSKKTTLTNKKFLYFIQKVMYSLIFPRSFYIEINLSRFSVSDITSKIHYIQPLSKRLHELNQHVKPTRCLSNVNEVLKVFQTSHVKTSVCILMIKYLHVNKLIWQYNLNIFGVIHNSQQIIVFLKFFYVNMSQKLSNYIKIVTTHTFKV